MTKADIIENVYLTVGFSKKDSAEIVELVFDTIKETLERGEKIKLSGFGNFIVRGKKSRVGRNPQTGKEIEISARRVLTFRPSQVLKNALNGPEARRFAAATKIQPPSAGLTSRGAARVLGRGDSAYPRTTRKTVGHAHVLARRLASPKSATRSSVEIRGTRARHPSRPSSPSLTQTAALLAATCRSRLSALLS